MKKCKSSLRAWAAVLFLLVAAPAFCLIDINTASQSELESLPTIGKVKAERIIKGRPYRSVSDLVRVKGIGHKTLNKFKDLVTVGTPGKKKEAVAARAAAAAPEEIPVYSVDHYRTLKCHRCTNRFRVSSDLEKGWCPYCGRRWGVKRAAAAQGAPAKAETRAGAVSWKDAARYIGQTKTIEGAIVGTYLSTRGSGNLYLNFHPDYRNNLSVKIPKASLRSFRSDAVEYYKGKNVLARGRIEKDRRGYLRLVVTDPKDLKVVE